MGSLVFLSDHCFVCKGMSTSPESLKFLWCKTKSMNLNEGGNQRVALQSLEFNFRGLRIAFPKEFSHFAGICWAIPVSQSFMWDCTNAKISLCHHGECSRGKDRRWIIISAGAGCLERREKWAQFRQRDYSDRCLDWLVRKVSALFTPLWICSFISLMKEVAILNQTDVVSALESHGNDLYKLNTHFPAKTY